MPFAFPAMTLDELQMAVHAALRTWGNLAGTSTDLLEDLLLVQEERAKKPGNNPTTRRLASNQVLLEGIDLLGRQDAVQREILTRRFLQRETILETALKMDLSEDQIKRGQREAISNLAHIIWEKEATIREVRTRDLQAQLPPATYSHLYGIQEKLDALTGQLVAPSEPWICAIVGIGGIGKTALADAATRQATGSFTFQQVAWLQTNSHAEALSPYSPEHVWQQLLDQLATQICPELPADSSAQQRLIQIRRRLNQAPLLVVIDDLESALDTAFLVQRLNELTNPSKFLLTTRARLPVSAAVWTVFLEELSVDDAIEIIWGHAGTIGLTEMSQAPANKLQPIYQAVGGNPLALKLVTGLAAVLPLPEILADLTHARSTEIARLYQHIYWKTWRSLSEESQKLLLMMPQAAGIGFKPDQMQAISGLTQAQLWPAISELVHRSLLEVRGTTWERRYGIHRLTDSFLRTEIIHWPDGKQPGSQA